MTLCVYVFFQSNFFEVFVCLFMLVCQYLGMLTSERSIRSYHVLKGHPHSRRPSRFSDDVLLRLLFFSLSPQNVA